MRATVTGLLLAASLTAAHADSFIFTSPPREDPARGQQDYGPIARYLSEVTGSLIVYQHPDNWLSYMKDMQQDRYDLVFDGPHFVSWRMRRLGHTPLVRLPGQLDFVAISRRDDREVVGMSDLAGLSVCAHAPPNLATLTLQDQFRNPNRQPRIREIHGFPTAYRSLLDGGCRGTMIPVKIYQRLSRDQQPPTTRVLYQSRPLPHQAFSAAPTIPESMQEQIRLALLDERSATATERLRKRFAGGQELEPADYEQYQGFAGLLRNFWGFGI